MSPKQIANSFHRDLFSKVSISLISLIAIGVFTTVYGILRANFVFADDLQKALDPINAAVSRIETANIETRQIVLNQNKLLESLAKNQIEIRIDYLEDQIRILRSKPKLSQEEIYRLSRYTDDLEKEKLKR